MYGRPVNEWCTPPVVRARSFKTGEYFAFSLSLEFNYYFLCVRRDL